MALNPPKVQIETSTGEIGDTMSLIRSWLDANRIQPIEFKAVTRTDATVSFMIRFESEAEAALFERAFAAASSN